MWCQPNALWHQYKRDVRGFLGVDVKQKQAKSERPASFTGPQPKAQPKVTPAESEPPSKPKRRFTRVTRRKVVTSLALLVVILIIWNVFTPEEEPKPTGDGPNYTTILPEGKSIVVLGGWKRISPPENDPVYAYSDTVDDVAITVSQQPIPTQFGRNIDSQVEKLAKGYNATEKIETDQATMYIGTSAKGPQSAILAKDDLLILIKSQEKLSNDAWKEYAQSLTTANLPNVPTY